jgi:hypothetical protein
MKIYMNKPKNSWISPYEIVEKVIFWREIDYDEPIVEFWAKVLAPFCNALYNIRRIFERDIKYIKIDKWDTWSMDSTLSPIILPMLKQLKATKHGAPHIDDEDVPPKLRANRDTRYKGNVDHDLHKMNDEVDKKFFKRFDYILDEMIWTFDQLSDWDNDGKFYDHTESRKIKDLNKSVRKLKVDRVGLKKHHARIDNGLRLFGKYYRTLWD